MNNALAHLSANDTVLKKLIESYPAPTFQKHTDYYQALVDSIIGQQLSVKAASAIEARFKALFSNAFPEPDQIIAISPEELRAVGLSRQKSSYIQDLAQKVLDGEVQFEHIESLTNAQIIEELTRVKGVGEWTVHMFLIFCMNRLNVLPAGDLGIRNGVTLLYNFTQKATPEDVITIATKNSWQPYESVASWYVWQSLENTPKTI